MFRMEHELLRAKIGVLLHRVFVDFRAWSSEPIPEELCTREQMTELADIMHNLPKYIVGLDDHALRDGDQLRSQLIHYVRKYYPDIEPEQHHYIQLFDLDPDPFWAAYRDHDWSVLNTAPTAHS